MKLTPSLNLSAPGRPALTPASSTATSHSTVLIKNIVNGWYGKFFFPIILLFLFALFPAYSFAQGWQMYIDDIKQDAAARRAQKNAAKSNGTALPDGTSSPKQTSVPERAFTDAIPSDTVVSQNPQDTSADNTKNVPAGKQAQTSQTNGDNKAESSARTTTTSGPRSS
ncbi:MAG: hypothetical protein Q4G59_09640, partial [Planctomycetia bacterium]|nr:hypothetical protein [Planctomycetia bacterium]